MHEAALARAALPAPSVVLGLLMRPYSLGHELFLFREGNPLATAETPVGITGAQLAQAALICCQTWQENLQMPFDWLIGLKMALWRWRVRNAVVPIEAAKFIEYRILGQLEFPLSGVVTPGRESGRIPGTPFVLRLQQFLQARLGLSETQAWDYPYGLAKMRWAAFWESEGGIDVYNASEAEFDDFIKDQEAKGATQCPA